MGEECSVIILLWKVMYISFSICSDLNFDNKAYCKLLVNILMLKLCKEKEKIQEVICCNHTIQANNYRVAYKIEKRMKRLLVL